jgi:hypothetical protein
MLKPRNYTLTWYICNIINLLHDFIFKTARTFPWPSRRVSRVPIIIFWHFSDPEKNLCNSAISEKKCVNKTNLSFTHNIDVIDKLGLSKGHSLNFVWFWLTLNMDACNRRLKKWCRNSTNCRTKSFSAPFSWIRSVGPSLNAFSWAYCHRNVRMDVSKKTYLLTPSACDVLTKLNGY